MFRQLLAIVIASLALIASPTPSSAQFDFGRQIRDLRLPRPDIRIDRVLRIDRALPKQLRRALGSVAVAAIGVAVLSSLSERERREVARRATNIVRGDPSRELVEVYEIKKQRKRVTIRVSPVKPKPQFADDPALVGPTADEPTPEDKPDPNKADEPVPFHQVAENIPCRTITTTVASLSTSKSDALPPESTTTAVVCELTEGDWKPVRK